MIPSIVNEDIPDFTLMEPQTSRTYRLRWEDEMIAGKCDELEAVRQAIGLILSTERYDHVIYSWNYGVELKDLIGMEAERAAALLPKRVTEALMMDDRIFGVSDFQVEKKRNKLSCSFTVSTVWGDVKETKEVSI